MTQASIATRIDQDIIAAMKARDSERTTALRMVKTALKNREIDKRAPLEEAEAVQVLTTLIKQRRDSIEQFTKGNRPELAAKEAAEISMIESYMPKAAGEDEIRRLVEETLAGIAVSGTKLRAKDIGPAMKAVQARIQATGLRADGRQVSEIVKAELAKQNAQEEKCAKSSSA
ncbi:MAG: GatB/YqeY domain-containing protein [Silvibacterium sp.]|nr:GatB/YqeY domain-containing protein [Silvibacterium sp.]